MTLKIELIDALKRVLKAQGMTYARLAARVGLSETSIKRMFAQGSMTLGRLDEICAALGVNLADLTAAMQRGRDPLATLSTEQEQALVDDPTLLLAMYLVLNRWQVDEVLAHYRFSEPQWIGLLARLDRLGVIELQPGNRARLLTARNFRWRSDGPMERLFRAKLLPAYFTPAFSTDERLVLLSGMVSPRSAEHLRRRLDELAAEFDLLMAQDAGLPAAERIGLGLVFALRPWKVDLFGPLRRESATKASPGVDDAD